MEHFENISPSRNKKSSPPLRMRFKTVNADLRSVINSHPNAETARTRPRCTRIVKRGAFVVDLCFHDDLARAFRRKNSGFCIGVLRESRRVYFIKVVNSRYPRAPGSNNIGNLARNYRGHYIRTPTGLYFVLTTSRNLLVFTKYY